MRNLLLSGLLLFVCATWVVAQTSSTSSTSPSGTSASSQASTSSSSGMGSSGSSNSIQGCLSGSTGNYTLTDNSGASYQLQGDDSQLSKHVGEEVQVKGSEGSASASSPSSSSPSSSASTSGTSGSSAAKSFNVTSVKKISSTCTSSKGK